MKDSQKPFRKLPSLHLFSTSAPTRGPYSDLEFIAQYRRRINDSSDRRPVTLPLSPAADMQSLRERIVAMASTGTSPIVLFNSPERATTSAELILEFAWERSKCDSDKILIIDCNLRSPVLNRVYNLARGVGLAEYLAGTHTVPDVVKRTNLRNVYLLRSGCLKVDPVQLLKSPRLGQLLKSVAKQFDFLLLNSPPYRDYVDSSLLAESVRPLVVLAVDGRGNGWDATADIRADMQRYDLNILGLVNRS